MGKTVKISRTLKDLRRQVTKWREGGKSVALVPTMGALHAGHLSLVKLAKKKADRVVVSIFVNPAQFAATEDLARYPRDEAGDIKKLATVDADLVWAPVLAKMYPAGFSTRIVPGATSEDLEGTIRPHHFAGVATVCCKLFSQVTPDIAIFGEKDYQQLCVLKQMARDLNLPLKILGAATEREKDGLAMSSRNSYLSDEERKIAPALHATISELAIAVSKGADVQSSLVNAKRKLFSAGFAAVDYVDVRAVETLEPYAASPGAKLRVLAAVRLGKTRLIDNVAVN